MQKFITLLLVKSLGLYINVISYVAPKAALRMAYKFFSEPRAGRLKKDQLPDILKEAKAEIITHNDFIFQAYIWPGNTTKVLLVHGWESNASRWELFLPYLKKAGATIIAVDAPAHGLSSGHEFTMPQYGEFIDIVVKKFEPQYIVGHSVGGATSLYYLSHYPDSTIEKAVILGAPCDLNTLLHNYAGMLSLNLNVIQLLKKHFFEHFKIKTHEFSGSVFASKITIPGLLAHDLKDEVVSFKEGKKIADAWPSAEFIITRGLGHSMHNQKLYNKIYSFLFEK